jgi:SAM-dependent methyltransferase
MSSATADPRWYRTAFGPLTAGFWTSLVPAERIEREAAFLEGAMAAPPGAALLDVPCGAGRHARVLGRRGYRVTGIDISPHMLAAAASEGAVEGVWLRVGEMTTPGEPQSQDGAYCWGNSFGYLPDEENRGFLARVAAALKPGARFALETGAVAEAVLASFQPRTTMEAGGYQFSAERRYELSESAMHIRYRIARGGEAEEFVARQPVYTAAEILRMAQAAGLDPVSLHGGIAGEPAALGKPLIAVFRRR